MFVSWPGNIDMFNRLDTQFLPRLLSISTCTFSLVSNTNVSSRQEWLCFDILESLTYVMASNSIVSVALSTTHISSNTIPPLSSLTPLIGLIFSMVQLD